MSSSKTVSDGDLNTQNPSDRHRRRRKQKKNKAPDKAGVDQKALEQVEIEYVPEKAELDDDDEFKRIFNKFSFKDTTYLKDLEKNNNVESYDEGEEQDDVQEKEQGVSNKKKKRMKIADLKQISSKPDIVEVWDTNSPDPKLLVYLKSYRNVVPVPRHWRQKRKYLHGKRGIEKQPFQLPEGIEKIRQAFIEKEDSKIQRARSMQMQTRMGKMDIDYQELHNAFFKYQTRPKLTSHGELYYEGKEFEVELRRREVKPGILSQELKDALGMQEGAPPPWLINMQICGPPPSYPRLKIPGLNAPIPLGANFGYQLFGWGKPPVDEYGCPLYGDVYGVIEQDDEPNYEEEPVDKSKHWGDLEKEEEEEVEEEEEEKEEFEDIV